MSNNEKAWKTSLAGGLANLATQFLYPLENVKVRFQANNNAVNNPIPSYRGIFDALNQMYKKEGLNALYRGVIINSFAGFVANSVFFYIYQDGKK